MIKFLIAVLVVLIFVPSLRPDIGWQDVLKYVAPKVLPDVPTVPTPDVPLPGGGGGRLPLLPLVPPILIPWMIDCQQQEPPPPREYDPLQVVAAAAGRVGHALTQPDPSVPGIRDFLMRSAQRAGEAWATAERAYRGELPTPVAPRDPAQLVDTPTPAAGVLLAARAGAAAGWSGEDLVLAVAIAGPESHYIPAADNPTSSALGLWQVLTRTHADLIAGRDMRDPYANAAVAYQIWADAGGFAGPWASTYGRGLHLPYMDEARAAVAALGAGGVIPAGYDQAAGCEPGVIPAGMPPGACPAPEGLLTATTIRACRVVAPMFNVETVYGWGLRGNATEHDDGRAVDFMTYTDQAKGQAIADYLVANAGELRVMYVIYRQAIWSPARADEGWRAMEDRGGTTANHYDHVHLSLLAEGGTV